MQGRITASVRPSTENGEVADLAVDDLAVKELSVGVGHAPLAVVGARDASIGGHREAPQRQRESSFVAIEFEPGLAVDAHEGALPLEQRDPGPVVARRVEAHGGMRGEAQGRALIR